MKQFSLATIPLVCAAIAPLSADSMGGQQQQQQQQQQAQAQQNLSQMLMMNQITPQAEPMVSHWAEPYITADFIWWRAEEDNLDFAFTGVQNSFFSDASQGRVKHPDFDYRPGFKVGAGLKFKHDGWDFYANYTWLQQNSDRESISKPNGSQLVNNIWLIDSPFYDPFLAPYTHAHAEWNLHFNALDLELGRDFYISKFLTLRPYFGLKFSWLHQIFHNEFSNHTLGFTNHVNHKMTQFGVGIRTGLDTRWYLWKHWSIFGNFAIAELFNDFNVHREDTAQVSGQADHSDTVKVKRKPRTVTPVIELALGFRYDTTFYHDEYTFYLEAGWEEQVWFNQNQFFNIGSTPPANLTLEGLTIETGFHF